MGELGLTGVALLAALAVELDELELAAEAVAVTGVLPKVETGKVMAANVMP